MSKIIESLRGDLAALHNVGAVDKVTMREFDSVCPPPVQSLKPHTTISIVQKREQGANYPKFGTTLKKTPGSEAKNED